MQEIPTASMDFNYVSFVSLYRSFRPQIWPPQGPKPVVQSTAILAFSQNPNRSYKHAPSSCCKQSLHQLLWGRRSRNRPPGRRPHRTVPGLGLDRGSRNPRHRFRHFCVGIWPRSSIPGVPTATGHASSPLRTEQPPVRVLQFGRAGLGT